MSVNNHKDRGIFEQVTFNKCKMCLNPGTICGLCIDNNRYEAKDSTGKITATVEEDSPFICRCCCPAAARTSKTKITLMGDQQATFFAEKDCKCGYFCPIACCHYPELRVTDAAGTTVGIVALNCYDTMCCKYSMDVYAGDKKTDTQKRFALRKCACNCGTLCWTWGVCCKTCGEIPFEVTDTTGSHAADFTKVWAGCWEECCQSKDKYQFQYPSESKEDKALWLATMWFVDQLFFESNGA